MHNKAEARVHSLQIYLLSASFLPDTVLGTGIQVSKNECLL